MPRGKKIKGSTKKQMRQYEHIKSSLKKSHPGWSPRKVKSVAAGASWNARKRRARRKR